ncbi:putative ferric reductase transmembrane component [Spathaspora sp. JA1]|nr:putative ferric reductase transmembrane component [Spathaspora sp. JA1]
MNLIYSLYLLLTLTGVQAHGEFQWYGKALALYGCVYEINFGQKFRFCPPDDKTCICSNENALATLAGCINYKNRNTTDLTDYAIKYCADRSKLVLEPNWFDIAFTNFKNNAVNQSDIKPSKDLVDVPVKFPKQEMDFFIEVASRFLLNYDNSIWYGVSVFGFWLLILLAYAVTHWTMMLFPTTTKKWTGPIVNFYRKHISNPALYGKLKSQSVSGWAVFDSLIPSRFESIIIALFYIFVTIINAVHTQAVENDPIFKSKYIAELRYVADRTGIIATLMMPLLFLYGGRNNLLQWLCGINYQTFMCYHRHIARVMVMLVVIHSVNYSILLARRRNLAEELKEPWLYWGLVATVGGFVMLIQSVLYLRRNWYELFLLVHIILAVLYVVGTWIHVEEEGYQFLVFPTVAVWCADRFVRLCRLFYFGFPKVNVTLVGDETIKMVIPKPKHWTAIPGGHAFVHFIKPTYFWQSHPFTFTNSVENDDNIVMYLKVKGGVTHSLYKLLNKCPGKTTTMRVGIEGPYGESTPAKYSDSAVFIAGGNGIPGIYSEIYDIALRSSNERKSVLKLVWVIREYESLVWFYDELLKLKNTNIETTIYVTRPKVKVEKFEVLDNSKEGSIELTKSKSSEGGDLVEQLKQELSHIQFEENRPNIEQLIENEINFTPGSISFVACGHPLMVDEIRYYTCKNIDNPFIHISSKEYQPMNLIYLIYLLLTLTGVQAHGGFQWYGKTIALYSCIYEITFGKTKFCQPGDRSCVCTNEQALASLAGCITYKNRNTTYLTDHAIEYCADNFRTKLAPNWFDKWTGPIVNFYRKHISNPALYGKLKNQSVSGWVVFDSLIPSRFESIIIALFYIFVTIINAVNIQAIEDEPIFRSKYIAELRFVGDRTGIIATVMMPLLFLFGGRNNFLQWVCGMNYKTFLCYHRHIARVMVMLVVIHSVTYTILLVNKKNFEQEMKAPWLYWGTIGTVAGGLMLIQSVLYLRRNWYELFVLAHIIMAVLYVVGTWIHVEEFGYVFLVYPTVAVWCADRFVRLCRLFYFGFPKVKISLVGDETIKMVIPKPKHWTVIPGGHAFVHFIKPTYFWQSHPFTFTNSVENDDNIVMYLKVKGGVTHSLYKLLNKCPGKTTTMRVGIEGPYGESTPAKYSDSAVFIAGGNGIPGIYSEIYDIALRSSNERKSVLKLVWVIREYESLVWFYDELLQLKNTNIETTVYVTKPNVKTQKFEELDNSKEESNESESKSSEGGDHVEQLKQELSHIQFEENRPSIEQLIENEINLSPGSISFVACGHPLMVDEVRYYSCKNIDNPHKKRVDFYEQLQLWA